MQELMKTQDAPESKMGTVFCTIGTRRYAMLNTKKVEVKASVETKEVPRLGAIIKGRKATGLEIQITMTVYKCSPMFDQVIKQFKETGAMPTFDLQVSSWDDTTSIGRDSKIYNNCIIDGDVLLSLVDAEGDFIEQEISAYADDFSIAEGYTEPSYM